MNYDTTGNQNYQGLQNPSSSYSNNQNPSSSYLKNQNPKSAPTRVAQAKTAASRNPEEKLLELIFPNQMKNVDVLAMTNNPNKLVKSVGFGAWTQSAKLIYYENAMPEFLKPFILYHEGLHILQFEKKGSHPNSFAEMLEFELFTYKKSDDWINNAALSKKFYKNNKIANNYESTKTQSKVALDGTNKIFITSLALKIGMVARRGLNYLLQVLSQSTISSAPKTMTYEDIVFKNMRDATNLPELKKGKNVYKVNDLYEQTTDEKFYEKFGY